MIRYSGRNASEQSGRRNTESLEIVAKLYDGQEKKYGWNTLPNFEGVRRAFFGVWIDGVIRKNADRIQGETLEAFFGEFKRLGEVYAETQTDSVETRTGVDQTAEVGGSSVQRGVDSRVSPDEGAGTTGTVDTGTDTTTAAAPERSGEPADGGPTKAKVKPKSAPAPETDENFSLHYEKVREQQDP